MSFAIRYYRDECTCALYQKCGIIKMPGFVTGRDRFMYHDEAQKLANHINSLGPQSPAWVISSKDPVTVARFNADRAGGRQWPSENDAEQ